MLIPPEGDIVVDDLVALLDCGGIVAGEPGGLMKGIAMVAPAPMSAPTIGMTTEANQANQARLSMSKSAPPLPQGYGCSQSCLRRAIRVSAFVRRRGTFRCPFLNKVSNLERFLVRPDP